MIRFLAPATVLAVIVVAGSAAAHPPYGLVADTDGNAYFSDLQTVWRVAPDGQISIFRAAVPGTHVHELALDYDGVITGDENRYDPQTQKFYSGLWRRTLAGAEHNVVPLSEHPPVGAGVWQDRAGNRYATEWISSSDRRTALLRRSPSGRVDVLYDAAAGVDRPAQRSVASVGGMAFGRDGSLFFADGSFLRRLGTDGAVEAVYAGDTGSSLRGVATATDGRVFVADMGKKTVLAIQPDGTVSVAYREEGPWLPTAVTLVGHRLLVLEANADPYEYDERVRLLEVNGSSTRTLASPPFTGVQPASRPETRRPDKGDLLIGGLAACAVLLAGWAFRRKKS